MLTLLPEDISVVVVNSTDDGDYSVAIHTMGGVKYAHYYMHPMWLELTLKMMGADVHNPSRVYPGISGIGLHYRTWDAPVLFEPYGVEVY